VGRSRSLDRASQLRRIRVTAGFTESKNVFKNNRVFELREVTETELVLRDVFDDNPKYAPVRAKHGNTDGVELNQLAIAYCGATLPCSGDGCSPLFHFVRIEGFHVVRLRRVNSA
jgi:hypothetical protein